MHMPRWVNDTTSDAERLRLRNRYLLNIAAVAFSPEGHLTVLSEAIGLSRATLPSYASRGRTIPAEVAIKIERAVGRDFVRREDIRPDLFGEEENARPE